MDRDEEAEFDHPGVERPMKRGEASTSHESSFHFGALQTFLDERFERIDARFDQLDQRFGRLEATQASLQGDISWLRTHFEGQQFSPSDDPFVNGCSYYTRSL